MSWRRVVLSLLVLVSAVVSLVGVTNVVNASPQATYGAPKEGAKVILADTSIDGPAIAWASPGTFIAWTGTDAQHHINLMTSTDGLHYSNKHILPEMSLWRPAIAFIGSQRTVPFEGTLVLAWTGTDIHHTLNLELISTPSFKVTQKITFWGETSFTAPAVGTINGDVNSDIYLAWAGTDSAHTLNIIHRTTFSKTQDKKILWGWSSISRPNLSRDLSSGGKGGMLLSWTGVNNRIYFADSTKDTSNKTIWTMASTSPLSMKSAWAPSMIGYFTTTQPSHWLAWMGSGTTSTRYLNVQYTQHYPSWNDANSKTILNETAISSPTLAFSLTTDKGLIGWAGTDPQHHLNVAVVSAPA
jgi:hypothetical protein